MEHLEVAMADTKNHFDLVPHRFSNLSPSIESALSSLPTSLLDELSSGSLAGSFCDSLVLGVITGPNCHQRVSHELNEVTAIFYQASRDDLEKLA